SNFDGMQAQVEVTKEGRAVTTLYPVRIQSCHRATFFGHLNLCLHTIKIAAPDFMKIFDLKVVALYVHSFIFTQCHIALDTQGAGKRHPDDGDDYANMSSLLPPVAQT